MRVAVGMSGGVDSSVTAALLHEQGHEVIGLFMRLGVGHGDGAERRCCSLEDGRDAKRVADHIGIRFYDLDYRSTFRGVIDYFIDSYNMGETPNPCAICNRDVKFDALWKQAKDLGCEAIATGHYAKIVQTANGAALARGQDPNKDQSYFLFPIDNEVLNSIHFPLGELSKPQVRELAEKFSLPTKKKSESQDICFVGNNPYTKILQKETPDKFKEGKIVHVDGRELGTHKGHQFFTIGQRRGLGVAVGDPLFVTDKNPKTNTITVGPREALMSVQLKVSMHQWHSTPQINDIIDLQIRYNAPALKARYLGPTDEMEYFEFTEEQEKTSPGQAAVIYKDDIVMGGGWIK